MERLESNFLIQNKRSISYNYNNNKTSSCGFNIIEYWNNAQENEKNRRSEVRWVTIRLLFALFRCFSHVDADAGSKKRVRDRDIHECMWNRSDAESCNYWNTAAAASATTVHYSVYYFLLPESRSVSRRNGNEEPEKRRRWSGTAFASAAGRDFHTHT